MKQATFDLDTPPGYKASSAETKAEWLWESLILPTRYTPSMLPPLRMPFKAFPRKELGIVTKRDELEKSLTRTSDVMEPGRPKVIHALGAVAMLSLATSDQSPFTGLLGAPPGGGAIGLIRMSLVASVTRDQSYTPGFGLKLLVDGHASADLLGMNHTVGQGRDFNLFSNSMTNDLTEEHEQLRAPQKVMGVLFDRVSHQPRRLVGTHFTNQRRDGTPVEGPVTARRLVFRPTAQARESFKDKAGVDFRLVLAQIEPGTPLYEVDGLIGKEVVHVGLLSMTTSFVASAGGDRLFFRHVQAPEDRKT